MREDAGKYTVTASNPHGSDKGDLEVIVVDKPGPPRGPLSYDQITGTSVTMSWLPPSDNGGSDITGEAGAWGATVGGGWRQACGWNIQWLALSIC